MENRLVPEKRVDKNGKLVTRNVLQGQHSGPRKSFPSPAPIMTEKAPQTRSGDAWRNAPISILSDIGDYVDYNRFIQRIIHKTGQPEEIIGKLKRIRIQGLVNLSIVAGDFDDSLASLCFEVLTHHVKGEPYDDSSYSEVGEARFIDAVALITPLMDGKISSQISYRNQIIKLEWIASTLATSETGTSDTEIVSGFFLRSMLGYREHPDVTKREYKFLGQHYKLIASHWELFQERGVFDHDFILQLADPEGSKPLANGVL